MSTLKDALSTALQGSPLKKSLSERLWLYVKDHPGVTTVALQSIMKADNSKGVSRSVYVLRSRKMLLAVQTTVRRANGPRLTYELKVNPAMHGVYEVWPVDYDKSQFKVQSKKVKPEVPVAEPLKEYNMQVKTLADFEEKPLVTKVPQGPISPPRFEERKLEVANLPLAEARRIFDELSVFFKVEA